jgi:hypothetical protein
VGADDELQSRSEVWRRAASNPVAAGMTAYVDGDAVVSLPRDGGDYRRVARGAAVAVAVPTGLDQQDGVTMAITGTTQDAAAAAAARIAAEPDVLRDRYAVVFSANGVPLLAAGQGEL